MTVVVDRVHGIGGPVPSGIDPELDAPDPFAFYYSQFTAYLHIDE